MLPCYGYQIHDIDNELQLLYEYLWDPIQQNPLKKKQMQMKTDEKPTKKYQENEHLHHVQHHSHISNTTDSSISPNLSPKRQEIVSRVSSKSVSSNSKSGTPKKQYYLNSPNKKGSVSPTYSALSHEAHENNNHNDVTSIARISHSYNKRKHNGNHHDSNGMVIQLPMIDMLTKTQSKYGFFEWKYRV